MYIPTLRTAHTLTDTKGRISVNIIKDNIVDHYGIKSGVDVFTGLELYDLLDRDVRGRQRNALKKFENLLSERFFNKEHVEIIPEHTDETKARAAGNGRKSHGVISIKIGDEPERPIHTLGDGIQSLLILLYKVFMSKSETWFFIDEPEIGLHPGLQRIFLEVIASDQYVRDQKYRFFLTTHSNHLLDLTIAKEGVSVFSFSRTVTNGEPMFIVRNSSNDRLSILGKIGALNSSVLMANCSIWVEGPSDRLYIRKFLAIYCEKEKEQPFQEDIHYAFLEYAGSNLSHYVWSMENDTVLEDRLEQIRMQFLSNRIFLIADRDESKEQKHKYWKDCENRSGGQFIYYHTPGKEVENLLTPEYLKDLFLNGELKPRNLTVERKALQDLPMDHADYCPLGECDGYKPVGLAEYLVTKLGPDASAIRAAGSTGTFTKEYKEKVSKSADKYLTSANIGEPALQLAARIYQFIKRHNPAPDNTTA